MPVKDINELLNMTITNQKKKSDTLRQQAQNRVNKNSIMQQVVPPLHRGDFLDSWKTDREQLEKVRADRDKIKAERDKLRGILIEVKSKVAEERTIKRLKLIESFIELPVI